MCVQGLLIGNTSFGELRYCLVLEQTLEVPRKFLGTPSRRSLGIMPPSFHFCLETEGPVSSTTLPMRSCPGPHCLATVLVLLEFGGFFFFVARRVEMVMHAM